ncbi:uncharacterized protein MYCFIDRAFT_207966 [Pseudocercospora fijiensis CIRAD86]|uniref:Uncharacterized protein n=1 Tax=Pseudocercospora fijiensis (strain CIRAD86) TaxID=383855 RepID=M2ZS49_PSEFD|nr:uncharacterized protein MYCFIDRAFT_207966 [Pseudocercospora fijiensis CIRAD86]EME81859.1 hypothetical protein MYCFIDRAFT_207966 [Pseudocercospora fijiensis CIRAD86]
MTHFHSTSGNIGGVVDVNFHRLIQQGWIRFVSSGEPAGWSLRVTLCIITDFTSPRCIRYHPGKDCHKLRDSKLDSPFAESNRLFSSRDGRSHLSFPCEPRKWSIYMYLPLSRALAATSFLPCMRIPSTTHYHFVLDLDWRIKKKELKRQQKTIIIFTLLCSMLESDPFDYASDQMNTLGRNLARETLVYALTTATTLVNRILEQALPENPELNATFFTSGLARSMTCLGNNQILSQIIFDERRKSCTGPGLDRKMSCEDAAVQSEECVIVNKRLGVLCHTVLRIGGLSARCTRLSQYQGSFTSWKNSSFPLLKFPKIRVQQRASLINMGSPPYKQPAIHHTDFKDKQKCLSFEVVKGKESPTRRCIRKPLWALASNKAGKAERDELIEDLMETSQDMIQSAIEEQTLKLAKVSMCRQCGQSYQRMQEVALKIANDLVDISGTSPRPIRHAFTPRTPARQFNSPMPIPRSSRLPVTPASSVTYVPYHRTSAKKTHSSEVELARQLIIQSQNRVNSSNLQRRAQKTGEKTRKSLPERFNAQDSSSPSRHHLISPNLILPSQRPKSTASNINFNSKAKRKNSNAKKKNAEISKLRREKSVVEGHGGVFGWVVRGRWEGGDGLCEVGCVKDWLADHAGLLGDGFFDDCRFISWSVFRRLIFFLNSAYAEKKGGEKGVSYADIHEFIFLRATNFPETKWETVFRTFRVLSFFCTWAKLWINALGNVWAHSVTRTGASALYSDTIAMLLPLLLCVQAESELDTVAHADDRNSLRK